VSLLAQAGLMREDELARFKDLDNKVNFKVLENKAISWLWKTR